MKTNRRFLLVASLALALAFTISCSDDSDSESSAVCMIEEDRIFGKTCFEINGEDKLIDSEMDICENHPNGSAVDKCPGGFVKKCSKSIKDKKYGNGHITQFYYYEKFETMTCDEIDELNDY
jgi:hypothetical protein